MRQVQTCALFTLSLAAILITGVRLMGIYAPFESSFVSAVW